MSADIRPADGRLGILLPGMGAVATTFIAGVEAVKAGLGSPIGSLTQMGTIRLGQRTEDRSPRIKDFVPLADLDDLVFAGWDIFDEDVYMPLVAPACWTRTSSSSSARSSSASARCRRCSTSAT